ncbi:hypothetical protein O3P69_007514 [Scylla paramamosain]|uniref:Uncharacterized protein n=1 Tax=Scylla paramamosain TaxID=85552 RepID=A0AAW0V484_SCYPA
MVRVSGALPYVSLLLVVGYDSAHAYSPDDHGYDTPGGDEVWRSGLPPVLTEWHLSPLPTASPKESHKAGYALHDGADTTEDWVSASILATPSSWGEAETGATPHYARGKRKTWHPFDPRAVRSGESGSVGSHQELIEDGLEDLLSLYPGSWGSKEERRVGRGRVSHGRHKLRHGKRRRHHPRTLLLLEAGLSMGASENSETTLSSHPNPTLSSVSHSERKLSTPNSQSSSPTQQGRERSSYSPVGTDTPTPTSVPLLNLPLTFTSRSDDPPEKQQNSSVALHSGITGQPSEWSSPGGPIGAPPTTSQRLNGPQDDLLQHNLASIRAHPTEGLLWEQIKGAGEVPSQSQIVTHEAPRLVAGRGSPERSSQPLPSTYQDSSTENSDHTTTQSPENSRHDLRESNKRQTIKLGGGALHTSPMSPEAPPTSVGVAHAHLKHIHSTTPRPSATVLSTNWVVEDSSGRVRPQRVTSIRPRHNEPEKTLVADVHDVQERKREPNPRADRLSLVEHSPSITLLSHLATSRPDSLQHRPVPEPTVYEEPRTGGGGCYSTNDVVVVVFLTSLANMVAFVVVTVTLCWCSLRGRAAPPSRSSHPDDARQDSADDDAEETAVPEGCLEACLPDISYQRHLARGSSIRPSFVVGRALRPLVQGHSPRPLSQAVHELLHNLTTQTEVGEEGEEDEGQERREEKGKKRRGCLLKRRSLSLENLMLT